MGPSMLAVWKRVKELAHREETGENFHLQFILFHGTPGDFKADGEERNPGSGKRFQIL